MYLGVAKLSQLGVTKFANFLEECSFGSFKDRVVIVKRCLQIFTGPPQI